MSALDPKGPLRGQLSGACPERTKGPGPDEYMMVPVNTEEVLSGIIERNKRVEAEKAWERSFTRRTFLAILTYGTAALLLWLLNEPRFLLLSCIPAISYVFSKLTLPWIRKWWINRNT